MDWRKVESGLQRYPVLEHSGYRTRVTGGDPDVRECYLTMNLKLFRRVPLDGRHSSADAVLEDVERANREFLALRDDAQAVLQNFIDRRERADGAGGEGPG